MRKFVLLCIMMFLQFFSWGAWMATLAAAFDEKGLSALTGDAFAQAPIAAIIAPLFLGLIADRLFPSEKVMGVLMLVGGGLLFLIPGLAENGQENGETIIWLILAHLICFMPTLGLGNTIAFAHIESADLFPKVRVWGTIGWIAAGLTVGFCGWSNTMDIFWLGAISSVLLGVICFQLPNTPPPLKGQPMNLRSVFMVDAFKLLADKNYLIFAICSTLICVPLAYYYGVTSSFLNHMGFEESAATMTIGQMSEIFFMMLIPFFFRKLGLKLMILIGMGCWVVRYLLFAYGAPDQITWMLLLAVAVHGICYDFFFVAGFMYTEEKAPKHVRGQAQGLLVFLTQGVGMFFGYKIMAAGTFLGLSLGFTVGDYGKQLDEENKTKYTYTLSELRNGATAENIKAELTKSNAEKRAVTEPTSNISFGQQITKMFSRDLPADEINNVDPDQLGKLTSDWKNFWMFPAILAAAVFVLFLAAFWDKSTGGTQIAHTSEDSPDEGDEATSTELETVSPEAESCSTEGDCETDG